MLITYYDVTVIMESTWKWLCQRKEQQIIKIQTITITAINTLIIIGNLLLTTNNNKYTY